MKKLELGVRLFGRGTNECALRSGRDVGVSMTRQVDEEMCVGASSGFQLRGRASHFGEFCGVFVSCVRAARGLFRGWVRLEASTRFFGLSARSPNGRTNFDNPTGRDGSALEESFDHSAPQAARPGRRMRFSPLTRRVSATHSPLARAVAGDSRRFAPVNRLRRRAFQRRSQIGAKTNLEACL
ncbi:MAG: hypothetical protein QOE47_2019 [Pyrinomonadaceae bacterium]|nr:hypothetical protein [Pyrinomonadaceae bacterium]